MNTFDLIFRRIISISLFFLLALVPLMVNPTAMDYWYKPKIHSAYALICIAIAAAFARLLVCRADLRMQRFPGLLFLALFACSAVVSTVFSTDTAISLKGDIWRYEGLPTLLAYCALVPIFAWLVESREQAERLLQGLLVGTTLIVLYGIMQYFGYNPTRHFLPGLRVPDAIGSTIGNPNFFGKFLVLTGPLLLGSCLSSGRKTRLLSCGAIAVLIIALVLSMSSASWLGFACAGLLFLFMLWRFGNADQKKKMLLFGAVLSGALLILAVFAASGKGSFNIQQTIMKEAAAAVDLEKGAGSSTRLFIWKRVMPLIAERPVLGYGLDTHEKTYNPVSTAYNRKYNAADIIDRAHNNYIDLAISQGLFGLISYLGFIFSFLLWLWRVIKREKEPELKMLFCSIFCCFWGFLVNDFFAFSTVSVSVTFWSLIGLTISLGSLRSHQQC